MNDTIQDELLELKRRLQILEQRNVNVGALDELVSVDLGVMRAGNFLALVTAREPTYADATGVFLSAAGEAFGNVLAHLGGVNLGQLQFWLNSLDGSAGFSGGAGRIDLDGINLDGIRYALRHYATDPDGLNPSYGRFEMLYENGKTIPSLAITFMDGSSPANLVANPCFETGDFTNWTAGADWYVVSGGSHEGTYHAECGYYPPSGVSIKTLASDRFSVAALTNYSVTAVMRIVAGAPLIAETIDAYIYWYDDPTAGTLIRIDGIGSQSGTTWTVFQRNLQAPVGAQSAEIFYSTWVNNSPYDAEFYTQLAADAAYVSSIAFERKILFTPDPAISDGTNTRKIIAGVKELYMPKAPVISLVSTATGNCTNGLHYIKVAFVDSDGSVLGGISNAVTVDNSHKQITVPLELGPWGTAARYIYMSKINTASPMYLADVMADNTTTTINISVADASLVDLAPVYNTTGTRPLFPRLSQVMVEMMQMFNASNSPVAMVIANNANQIEYGHYANISAGANGDRYKACMFLEAGTYTFSVYYVKSALGAIMDLYLDGALINAGTDTYSAVSVFDQTLTVTGITVTGSNYHLVEWVVNGRNGSNTTGWRSHITYMAAKQANY